VVFEVLLLERIPSRTEPHKKIAAKGTLFLHIDQFHQSFAELLAVDMILLVILRYLTVQL